MRVEFKTTEYEFSHGCKPKGNGGWLFLVRLVTPLGGDVWGTYGTYGTFGAAKAKIKADLSVKAIGRRNSRFAVTVMP